MLTALMTSDTSLMPGNWLIESGQSEGLSLPKIYYTHNIPPFLNFPSKEECVQPSTGAPYIVRTWPQKYLN